MAEGTQAEAVHGSGSQGSLASQSSNLFQLCLSPPFHPQLLQKTTLNLSVLPAAKSPLSKHRMEGGQLGSIPSTVGWVLIGPVPNPRTRTGVNFGVTGACCTGRVSICEVESHVVSLMALGVAGCYSLRFGLCWQASLLLHFFGSTTPFPPSLGLGVCPEWTVRMLSAL